MLCINFIHSEKANVPEAAIIKVSVLKMNVSSYVTTFPVKLKIVHTQMRNF